jgi:hypothetical protein
MPVDRTGIPPKDDRRLGTPRRYSTAVEDGNRRNQRYRRCWPTIPASMGHRLTKLSGYGFGIADDSASAGIK